MAENEDKYRLSATTDILTILCVYLVFAVHD